MLKRKELAKDVHWIVHSGSIFTDTSDSGLIMHNRSKSLVVAEDKEK